MDRRIFGLETEYGVACTSGGTRRLTPDEVARYLFRRVVTWGRSSNVFLRNGSRIYLDVGLASRVRDRRVRRPDPADQPRPRGGADPGGSDRRRRAPARQRGDQRRHLPVQEQHRQPRQFLRMSRELPDLPDRRLLQDHRRAGAVSGLASADLRRRQGAPHRARRRVQRQPAGRAHLGERVVGDDPQPPDHQHPGRAARRPGALSAPARDRRRLQHERDNHPAQGRVRPNWCCG